MRILSLALLALALAACGFHLRGAGGVGALRLTTLNIQSTSAPDTRRLVAAGFQRLGGKLDEGAPLSLQISELVNRQSSVIAPTVKTAERTVYYQLTFQLRHASGVPAQTERYIRLRRGFQFDNTRIVGKFEEENLIIDDMRQQAVAQLLTQLSYVDPASLAPDVAPAPAAAAAPLAQP